MSFRKSSQQEFQHQFKDIRSQLVDQMKTLDQRTSDQIGIFQEISDFIKRRAELELQYSKELDKLAKSVMLKHKNERQKRINWPLHSACNLWQQIVDDTKEEAKQKSITSEIYANNVVPSIANKCATLHKLSKKCREIGHLAQGEVIRVINELQTAMRTYQHCFTQQESTALTLQQANEQKKKAMEANSSSRKQRLVQKYFDKRKEKFEVAKQKCTRARNEYILCIDAANASLFKYFSDDISDIVDCCDLSLDWWLSLLLQNISNARKSACQAEMNALANLGSFKDSLRSQADKNRFFENNHQIFMMPQRFDFKSEPNESMSKILAENLTEEFKQRHHQIRKRLTTLRSESEISWKNMEEMERQIRDILAESMLVEINEFGIADNRPPPDEVERELGKLYESYLQAFSYFVLNSNLVTRLEARANGIANGLKESNGEYIPLSECNNSPEMDINADLSAELSKELLHRRKKRIGSQVSTEQSPFPWARPRLFSGSLEEYSEVTGELIPTVIISSIRVLSQFALQHQGIFRISGSQIEINRMREAFECGEDPLKDVKDASDVNSIASLMKLYLRELREPLFPFYLFDLITDCAKCSTVLDFISKISPLMQKLPRCAYLLLRYLFAFLNHLSEFSDENMMDPYNLAICFGPTLLPIPEGKDQVIHQNSVNEVIKNLIVHSDAVFSDQRILGPRYEKYNFSTIETPAETELELYMDDEEAEEKNIPSSHYGYAIKNAEQQHQIKGRLPFLANYPPPEQSTMECSANSSFMVQSRKHIPQLSDETYPDFEEKHSTFNEPMGSRNGVSKRLASRDFFNNYSSSESGLDSTVAQQINALRLISPTQNRTEDSGSLEVPSVPNELTKIMTDKHGSLENAYDVPVKETPADLYASIKRGERIRIAISPRQQSKNIHQHGSKIEFSNLVAGTTDVLHGEAVNPPPYSSLFEGRDRSVATSDGVGNQQHFASSSKEMQMMQASSAKESTVKKQGDYQQNAIDSVTQQNQNFSQIKTIDELLNKLHSNSS